jgi:hypothetical protein
MLGTPTAPPERQHARIAGSGSFLKKRTKKLLVLRAWGSWGTESYKTVMARLDPAGPPLAIHAFA